MDHEITTDCKREDCNGCVVCQCGICAKCGLYEGALTTDCPLEQVSFDKSMEIYNSGQLDFRNGEWVKEPNPTNQSWIKAGLRKKEKENAKT